MSVAFRVLLLVLAVLLGLGLWFFGMFPGLAGLLGGAADPDAAVNLPESWGQFQGEVQMVRPSEEAIELAAELVYIDPSNQRWTAPAGTRTHGQLIPQPLRSLLGQPLQETYSQAVLLHQVACAAKQKPWPEVHRLLYRALRCCGMEEKNAQLLYWALYHSGPRWKEEARLLPDGKLQGQRWISPPLVIDQQALDQFQSDLDRGDFSLRQVERWSAPDSQPRTWKQDQQYASPKDVTPKGSTFKVALAEMDRDTLRAALEQMRPLDLKRALQRTDQNTLQAVLELLEPQHLRQALHQIERATLKSSFRVLEADGLKKALASITPETLQAALAILDRETLKKVLEAMTPEQLKAAVPVMDDVTLGVALEELELPRLNWTLQVMQPKQRKAAFRLMDAKTIQIALDAMSPVELKNAVQVMDQSALQQALGSVNPQTAAQIKESLESTQQAE